MVVWWIRGPRRRGTGQQRVFAGTRAFSLARWHGSGGGREQDRDQRRPGDALRWRCPRSPRRSVGVGAAGLRGRHVGPASRHSFAGRCRTGGGRPDAPPWRARSGGCQRGLCRDDTTRHGARQPVFRQRSGRPVRGGLGSGQGGALPPGRPRSGTSTARGGAQGKEAAQRHHAGAGVALYIPALRRGGAGLRRVRKVAGGPALR